MRQICLKYFETVLFKYFSLICPVVYCNFIVYLLLSFFVTFRMSVAILKIKVKKYPKKKNAEMVNLLFIWSHRFECWALSLYYYTFLSLIFIVVSCVTLFFSFLLSLTADLLVYHHQNILILCSFSRATIYRSIMFHSSVKTQSKTYPKACLEY